MRNQSNWLVVRFVKEISFLKKGITSASFSSSGNMPLFKKSLIMLVRSGKEISIESIKILTGMQELMADFLFLFRLYLIFLTSIMIHL